MKIFLPILLLAGLSSLPLHAQVVQTLKAKGGDAANQITITADQTVELLSYVASTISIKDLSVDLGGGVVLKPESIQFDRTNVERPSFVFQGPATVTLDAAATASTVVEFATVKISSSKDNLAPSNAVVIPADGAGPTVNVILEQSVDLLTWTAANPGIYLPTTSKRFFRVRIVPQ